MKKKTHRHPDNGGNKRAKRWLGSYDDPDGNEVSKAFRTRAAADKWGKAREAEVERGEWIDPRAGKTLVRAEGQKWLRLRRGGYGTRARYTSVWHNHVEPAFGERPVKSIKPSELAEYFQGLALTHGYPTQQSAITQPPHASNPMCEGRD